MMAPRVIASLALAAVSGFGIGWMDSRPGFDATGVTVASLLIAGAVAALVEGSGSFGRALVLIALVGGWIPIFESGSLPASAAALVFAAIGAFAGAWSSRLRRSGDDL
jgi:hypothetical protein